MRDAVMGRDLQDFDFAVENISKEDLVSNDSQFRTDLLSVEGQVIGIRLFGRNLPKEGVEIAITRSEVSTGPGHRDWQIDIGKSIEEDLYRRDFTCNAIAREINLDGSPGNLIDPLGGLLDIKNGVLRQTHSSAINEDPLRILRALARVSSDGFSIDRDTLSSMTAAKERLSHLSSERIEKEIRKIVRGPCAKNAIEIAIDTGIFQQVFPELEKMIGFNQNSKYHNMSLDQHSLAALEKAKQEEEAVLWAALLHDSGKPDSAWTGRDGRLHYYRNDEIGKEDHAIIGADISEKIMTRLRFPNQLKEEVVYLVKNHMWQDEKGFEKRSEKKQGIIARRFLHRHGEKRAFSLISLRRADDDSKKDKGQKDLDSFAETVSKELQSPYRVADLDISGNDLLAHGFQGQEIGQVLDRLLERILLDPELNQKERLLNWALKMKPK